MTPTRDELAALILDAWYADPEKGDSMEYAVADVVLPLLAEKDARIAQLEREREQSLYPLLEAKDARIAELEAFIGSGKLGVQVAEQVDGLVAELDAALAELEGWKRTATEVTVLHEAALAEVERLTAWARERSWRPTP